MANFVLVDQGGNAVKSASILLEVLEVAYLASVPQHIIVDLFNLWVVVVGSGFSLYPPHIRTAPNCNRIPHANFHLRSSRLCARIL